MPLAERKFDSFKKKKVLVTGGTGLIGIPLVRKLLDCGAKVRVVSLDDISPFGRAVEFRKADLCDRACCERSVKGMDIVFHLAGIKGGIGVAGSKAANFLVRNIFMNTLVMEASRLHKVEKFLFASSICVYPPADIFQEENAWTGLPHVSDRFGGMSKLVGEMQIEAYKAQYGLKNFFIARPVNTYGPYDNFDPASALIIPALIARIYSGENPLVVWGDGSAQRDFIYCDDAAEFLLLMMEKNAAGPYNVGSGRPVHIKDLVRMIVAESARIFGKNTEVRWDTKKPSGEKSRVASIKKAQSELQWSPSTGLEEGIARTISWYCENAGRPLKRYSILSGDR